MNIASWVLLAVFIVWINVPMPAWLGGDITSTPSWAWPVVLLVFAVLRIPSFAIFREHDDRIDATNPSVAASTSSHAGVDTTYHTGFDTLDRDFAGHSSGADHDPGGADCDTGGSDYDPWA